MTQQGGQKAQQTGKNIEQWVDASLRVYQHYGQAIGQINYPEIQQRGYQARVIGKAGPDRTVAVKQLGGKCLQIEIKTWKGKDTHLYDWGGSQSKRRRQLQYQTMVDWVEFGSMVFYLVCWRHPSFTRDWRIYFVNNIPVEANGLRFNRKDGLLVTETPDGWPDWLGAILSVNP